MFIPKFIYIYVCLFKLVKLLHINSLFGIGVRLLQTMSISFYSSLYYIAI